MPTTRSQGIATIEPADGARLLICLPDGRVEHRGLPLWGAIFITILILSSGAI